MKLPPDDIRLRGIEKAAILFICLGEAKGSELMRQLTTPEIQALVSAMSTLGTIPAATVEKVLVEFSENVSGSAGVQGSIEMAERLLLNFMNDDQVAEIMGELKGPASGRNVWEAFSTLNEQTIASWLRGEHDQTVAAILTRVKPDVAARVVPLFGPERMAEIITRMIRIDMLPRHVTETLEHVVRNELLAAASRKTTHDSKQRMADMFNKMDGAVFDRLSEELEQRAPAEFAAIKQKMFTFDDLIRLDASALQRIIRMAEGKTLALALRGAKKHVRDGMMETLTQRMQDMLRAEMQDMGPVRARDTREAQSALIDIANELARQEIIRLPTQEDELLE
ncbi:flagellar motor switch protein FliG [Tabrizicola sp.]|uniref:flagellar motor switch protein FliG n=1 Tax=Tabrizicola sp. TaxID=2005166 RepID=UPI0035B05076